jgi:hypothetical protein
MLQLVLEFRELGHDGFALGLNSGICSLGSRAVDIVNSLCLYPVSIKSLWKLQNKLRV